MLESFNKIQSSTPDLNDVQENVFNTVRQLQSLPLIENYSFEDRVVPNATETNLGIIQVPRGEFVLHIDAVAQVRFSGLPTFAAAYIMLKNVSKNEDINEIASVNLGRISSTLLQDRFVTQIPFTSNNSNVQALGWINVSGGTVIERRFIQVNLFAHRRTL